MSVFNHHGRTRNAVLISSVGLICNTINVLSHFVYRSLFLHFLSASYLGLQGLFGDVLSLLSLASLGIDMVFAYQCYEPISRNDVRKVGQLMNFIRKTYRLISLVILGLGLLVLPFLEELIHDPASVPSDVNLQWIYLLFLFQSLISYICTYRQMLLKADQRQYLLSIANTLFFFIKYTIEIGVLYFTGNFTLSLTLGILSSLFYNVLLSIWVTKEYRDVFQVRESLPVEDRRQIYSKTKAALFHKIGGTIFVGTDNLVISHFIGLSASGLYANYSLVFSGLVSVLTSVIGNLTSTIGNAKINQEQAAKHITFQRLIFLNFWLCGIFSVCFYTLADSFITIWVGRDMVLPQATLLPICIHFYLSSSRMIGTSYINGCGLFVKDRIRPLIEAAINILFSVMLVKRIGLPGVFWGTVISQLCTVFWREPYLLYKYEFKCGTKAYWRCFSMFAVASCINAALMRWIHRAWFLEKTGFAVWIGEALLLFILCNLILCICFLRSPEFLFYVSLLKKELSRLFRKTA